MDLRQHECSFLLGGTPVEEAHRIWDHLKLVRKEMASRGDGFDEVAEHSLRLTEFMSQWRQSSDSHKRALLEIGYVMPVPRTGPKSGTFAGYETYAQYLQTAHWKQVRQRALQRADGACQLCNSTIRLDVHHRTYENLGHEYDWDVTVLCRECHGLFHQK